MTSLVLFLSPIIILVVMYCQICMGPFQRPVAIDCGIIYHSSYERDSSGISKDTSFAKLVSWLSFSFDRVTTTSAAPRVGRSSLSVSPLRCRFKYHSLTLLPAGTPRLDEMPAQFRPWIVSHVRRIYIENTQIADLERALDSERAENEELRREILVLQLMVRL